MDSTPTLAELLALVIVLSGITLALWALVDDVWDLYHVYRFGESGGPRWVAATEHLISDLTFLGAWSCILGVLAIVIYLPAREDVPAIVLSGWAGWLRFGSVVFFLLAQINRRVGRLKLRALPLEAWERMLTAMVDGLTPAERMDLTTRLLQATTAGRQLGHAVRGTMQAPIALLDEIARDEQEPAERRAQAATSLAALQSMLELVTALHAVIKQQEPQAS